MMQEEIVQAERRLKVQLKTQTASLIIDCAEKFLQKMTDKKDRVLIDKLISEIAET